MAACGERRWLEFANAVGLVSPSRRDARRYQDLSELIRIGDEESLERRAFVDRLDGELNWVVFGRIDRSLWMALVSSRQPKRIDPCSHWVARLHAALDYVASCGAGLVLGVGSTRWRLFVRAALRRQIPLICVWTPARASVRLCASDCLELVGNSKSVAHAFGWSNRPESSLAAGTPWRDRVPIRAAEEVIALAVRSGGHVAALLEDRLLRGGGRVRLMVNASEIRAVHHSLARQGATLSTVTNRSERADPPSAATAGAALSEVSTAPFTCSRRWLSHATRACPGPWPGQTWTDYLDSVLSAIPGSGHTEFDTLLRIIQRRYLIASQSTIRGGYEVVCFTEHSPWELTARRTFRSHRGRWDFEPYGLSIDLVWLFEAGARPVIYGDDECWDCMDESSRPYFQFVDRDSGVDWSTEREWRHIGDVDLERAPAAAARVFVPSIQEANVLRRVSPWPIDVVDSTTR